MIKAAISRENHTNVVLLVFVSFLKDELNRDEKNSHALRICDYGKLSDQKLEELFEGLILSQVSVVQQNKLQRLETVFEKMCLIRGHGNLNSILGP